MVALAGVREVLDRRLQLAIIRPEDKCNKVNERHHSSLILHISILLS